MTDIANYRPILLTEVTRRLFERIILRPITDYIESLSVKQEGFQAERRTIDQISTLQE